MPQPLRSSGNITRAVYIGLGTVRRRVVVDVPLSRLGGAGQEIIEPAHGGARVRIVPVRRELAADENDAVPHVAAGDRGIGVGDDDAASGVPQYEVVRVDAN